MRSAEASADLRRNRVAMKMKWMRSCIAMAACLAGASAASAGTSSGTGTANMNVINQCTVTGANVHLGGFRTTDTVNTVVGQIGYRDLAYRLYHVGTNGVGTVPLGSVTCDNGTPYTITMDGNGVDGSIEIQLPEGNLKLYPMVRTVGDLVVKRYDGLFGIGATQANLDRHNTQILQIADGAPQQIMGNLIGWDLPIINVDGVIGLEVPLSTPGVYSGSWTTTLNF